MSILVTGSSGFIGNRFIELLKKRNLSFKTIGRNKKDDFYGDFEKDSLPLKAFEGVDSIVHIAGYAHDIKNTEENKKRHDQINFKATENLIKKADSSGVKKFIFISSVKAGGTQKINGMITEESIDFNEMPYSIAKRKSEEFLINFKSKNNIEKIIIRPSLVYGKNMKGNLNLMMRFIKMGFFPPLPDLDTRKALVHVDDVARAILFVSQTQNLNNEIFCLTDGNLYTPRDIYKELSISVGKSPKNWQIPHYVFKTISYLPFLKSTIKKIFQDEPYSSAKIQSLGYKPLLELKQINEKAF